MGRDTRAYLVLSSNPLFAFLHPNHVSRDTCHHSFLNLWDIRVVRWVGFCPFSLPLGYRFLEFGKSGIRGWSSLHPAEFVPVSPSILSILEGFYSIYTIHPTDKIPLL